MAFDIHNKKTLGAGKFHVLRLLLLASIVITVIISLILVSEAPDSEPDSMIVALRINENVTAAHIWTHDFARGNNEHSKQDIVRQFDWVSEYIEVVAGGGEIEGTTFIPLDTAEELQQMQKIEQIISQMKTMTISYLAQDFSAGSHPEFDREYDGLFLELVRHTNRFSTSSLHYLQRYHRRFQILQICVLVMGLGFALAVIWISRISDKIAAEAWNQVKRIEEQKDLALEGAKLATWDWNVVTGSLVVNDRWLEMVGLDPKKITPSFQIWEDKVHPDDLAEISEDLKNLLEGKILYLKSEYRMMGEDGQWVWILDLGKVSQWDSDGKSLRAAGIQLDITDIKMGELKLRREKERAQLYLDMARVIFVAMDSEGFVQMINREGCKVLGYSEQDIVGKKWMETFVPQRFRQSTQAVANELLSNVAGKSDSFVNPVLTSDGKEALIAWHNTPLYNDLGDVVGHLSSGTDITRRDKREKALQQYQKQLQSLAAQLAQTEDHLRQEIAAGLHDSIGQNLAALKLSIDIMRLNMGADPDSDDANNVKGLASVSQTIDQIVREIWSLSFQLCPPGLQESGIVSALEWLISEYNQDHDCAFRLDVQESHLEIGRTNRGQLFQMIRELLINTIKHGEASEVDVILTREKEFLLATVTDNGKGFDASTVMAVAGKAAGFGLFSIRERLAFISGKLEIFSAAGKGTKVVIRFPMEEFSPQDDGVNA